MRLFEAANPMIVSARESALGVAEQLGFQQSFRKRRAVHADHRKVGTRARHMDGAGHQLFAGSCFPGDEDRHLPLRNQADDLEYVPKGWVLANQELTPRLRGFT